MMPVMNGEEFLEARGDSKASVSPVVVVSAVSFRANKAQGVAAAINKPVDMDGFLDVVKRHCRRDQQSVAS
jgi:DNA-binding response OmpR family regulator